VRAVAPVLPVVRFPLAGPPPPEAKRPAHAPAISTHSRKATTLSPLYDEAADQYKRILAMDENNVNAYVWLIDTLAFQGKETEAFEWFIRSLNSRRTDEKIIRAYESAFQTRGWDEVLREQAKRFEETDEVYFRGAGIQAQIGNKDEAFEYLEKSFQRRELWMYYLRVHPLVDSLRDDPRFADLLARVESR